MFEKEAEEYAGKGGLPKEKYLYGLKAMSFRDGAEFGYHEGFKDCAKSRLNVTTISDCPIKDDWHYVKDGDLPKHENYVLVSNGKDWTKGFYKDKKWNVISLVGFIKIIMWKEIVLPELPKESE